MTNGGARVWYFADGYLPEKKADGALEAHEALMLLNVGTKDARVKLDFYFDDRDPSKDIAVSVPAERIISLRLDHPDEIGIEISPLTQYAIRVRSDVRIIAQFGRLDTTQSNLSYYSPMGYFEEEA